MENPIRYLGIDVGRSGVKLAFDAGKETKRQRIPKFADYVDWKSDQMVDEFVRQWCAEIGRHLDAEARVVIGASGAAEFERVFSVNNRKMELLGDVTVAALSCGIADNGILMIAGTGAALVVFTQNSKSIMNAYGPVVGDLWGGLALGRLAIRHLLDVWALNKEMTRYESALSEELGIQTRHDYVNWLQTTENHYGELGLLGKVTLDFAESGHEVAQHIARAMTAHMSRSVSMAVEEFDLNIPLAYGIQGSMLEKSDWVRDRIREDLARSEIKIEYRTAQTPLETVALDRAKHL